MLLDFGALQDQRHRRWNRENRFGSRGHFREHDSVSGQLYFTRSGALWQLDRRRARQPTSGIPSRELTTSVGVLSRQWAAAVHHRDGTAAGPQYWRIV